jgi:hypothetical protein
MNSNNALLLVCVVFGVLVLMYYVYNSNTTTPVLTPTVAPEGFNAAEKFMGKPLKEGFEEPSVPETTMPAVPETSMPAVPETSMPAGPVGHMQGEVLAAQDLLPQCADSPYAQVIPNGQGSLNDSNLLNAGYHLGVDTVGSSLRNANRQLRSEPPNPQVKVSPWNQTTIEADMNRRELEIGN